MTRKRLMVRLGWAAGFCAAATLYWYYGHRPIGYHKGFSDLPKKSCEYLNAYFTNLGYDREQLGLHH